MQFINREESGILEGIEEFRKRAERVQFNAYDPRKYGCPIIKDIAKNRARREYREEKVKGIITLEKMAEERLRLHTEETKQLAFGYHAKAIEVAKNLNDPEILQKLKDRFNEVSKEVYK